MSYPVNIQALPSGVLEEVFTPENMRGRNSVSSFTQLSFPKSRSALWDGSPGGEKLRLHLCSHRRSSSSSSPLPKTTLNLSAKGASPPRYLFLTEGLKPIVLLKMSSASLC